jgi:dTDP-4-amino-4,6-dideoxygalactose transaminase
LKFPVQADFAKHVYHLYVVRTEQRNALQEVLKEKGIGTLIHYPIPLHKQNAFKSFGGRFKCPVTEELSSEILSLPLFPQLSNEMQSRIIDTICEFFQSRAGVKS